MSIIANLLRRLALLPLEVVVVIVSFVVLRGAFAHGLRIVRWPEVCANPAVAVYPALFTVGNAMLLHIRLWGQGLAGESAALQSMTLGRHLGGGLLHAVLVAIAVELGIALRPAGEHSGMLLSLLATAVWWITLLYRLQRTPGNAAAAGGRVRRGTVLTTPADARHRAREPKDATNKIAWGGVFLDDARSESHFCVVGAPGSGKTVLIRLLMQSVLSFIGVARDRRAIVYDAKEDTYPMLVGMGVPEDAIVMLNPFDQRGAAWDIAKDVTSPVMANEIASVIIPELQGDHNPFFTKAARDLLGGVITALLIMAPGRWTLRDVVNILPHREWLRVLFGRSAQTRDLIKEYLEVDQRLLANVRVTVRAFSALLRPVAALWARSPRTISLREWIESESILLLGNNESLRTAIDAVNRVIFHVLSKHILHQSESRTRRTWVFLDEVKEAGKLDGLSTLLTKGRSKGARMVLGFQDIEGLRSIYGREAANELASLPANKAILHLDSPETAQWASQVIGESEVIEHTISRNRDAQGNITRALNMNIQKRDAVMPSEILGLPVPRDLSISGYFITPSIGSYRLDFAARELLRAPARVPSLIARPDAEQYLDPMNEADFIRLRLPPSLLHIEDTVDSQPAAVEEEDADDVSSSPLSQIHRIEF